MTTRQTSGLDAKQRIFIATLEIIKVEGMRGVRHRAVAAKAGVSLGSTTYHFKNIEDLITSTFIYWHLHADVGKNPHFITISQDVISSQEQGYDPQKLALQLFEDGDNYLRNQIFEQSDERRIELAFHNEAMRNPELSKVLLDSWKAEVQRIQDLYEMMGTACPKEDAEITFALVLQLEKKAMLIKTAEALDEEFIKMREVLRRLISLLTGLPLPTNS